jgi:peptidoglycan/LPS O-acetylase OafA/YrhL
VRYSNVRNSGMDVLRVVFALLVLLSHAQEIPDGDRARELLSILTHRYLTFGDLGVDGFFLLSGFLIVKSWKHNPDPINYLKKRVLRIVPGYMVAAFLSTIVVGLLVPGAPNFFSNLGFPFAKSVLLLGSPVTPIVFPGSHFTMVNGAMWTITFEFFCYLLVLLLGVCGIFKCPNLWLLLTAALLIPLFFPLHTNHDSLNQIVRLTAVFFVGGCFYLFRESINFRPRIAIFASLCLGIFWGVSTAHVEGAFVVFGGYLMFYLIQIPFSVTFPDVSYGIYLYGWPVESLWIWYRHGHPSVTFIVSAVICFSLGWLSWHFIERPMLSLKRKSAALVPVA